MEKTEPKNFSLEQLQLVLGQTDGKVGIFLYPTKRWMEWADTNLGDARIMQVDESKDSLVVSFSNGSLDLETIEFDERMRFYLKKLKS